MGEVLSQAEIDMLLAALTSGAVSAEELREEEKKKRVRVYDFRRPNKFSKDQLHTVRNIYENYSRSLSTFLSAMLRTMVQSNVLSVEQLTYDEFVRSMPDPSIIGIVNFEPLPGSGIVEINPSLAFVIIDRLFGGPGQAPEKARGLTEIERTVMERLIQRMVDLFQEPWAAVTSLRPRVEFIETNPQFTQIVSANEMVILVSIETKIGEHVGLINICIPFIVLEPVISRLSVHYWYATTSRAGPAAPEQSEALRRRIENAVVPMVVILGRTTITVADLLDLQIGDVVPLERKVGEPLEIVVGSKPKFVGYPGLVGNHLGVQITALSGNGNGVNGDEEENV